MYLEMSGLQVETVNDGLQAIDRVIKQRPDVIVMDLDMPQMNGWNAITRLQADPSTATIPVIVLTGHDFKDYLGTAALAAGARSFLTKPCLPDRLAMEIRKLLQHAAQAAPRAVRAPANN